MGGNISNRPDSIRKKAVILPGRLLDLKEWLGDDHKDSKRAAREATAVLGDIFNDCIEEYLHGQAN